MKTRQQIIEDAEKRLLEGVPKSKTQVFDSLTKLLTEFDKQGGRIQFNNETLKLINDATNRIYAALNKSGYDSRVKQYLKDFDKIKLSSIAEQKSVNGLSVSERSLNNLQKSAIQQTQNILLGNGLEFNLIQPVKDVLIRAASTGMTIAQAELQLRNSLDANMQPYAETHARQAILSYDGMIQGRIQKDFDLDGFSYEGSIIATSAGQCVRWAEMGEIPIAEIDKELKWARDNEGSVIDGHKVSALIKGTSRENFPINRGHWGCRHSCTAIRL